MVDDDRPRVYWDAERARIRVRGDDPPEDDASPEPPAEAPRAATEAEAAEPLDVWLRRTRRRARTR